MGTGKHRWFEELNRQLVNCRRCPRLIAHCQETARQKRRAFRTESYWGRPVPNFGDPQANLLIVGLAPGAHGANRTGRMFTGDRSGDWLYRALHRAGFANQYESKSRSDGMQLSDCAITAVCHCAPPGNRPQPEEILQCQRWLDRTIEKMQPVVILALGQIAWRAILDFLCRCQEMVGAKPKFRHGQYLKVSERRHILASYHPSQQNTFTGRLTESMLDEIMSHARKLVAQTRRLA